MGPRAALLVAALLGFAAYAAVAQHTTFASLLSSHDDYRGEPDHRDRDNYPHHHPYGDSTHICLRKRSVRKCDIVGLLAGVTYESGLECCPSDSRYGDGPNGNLPRDGDFGKAAKCTWRLEPLLIRTAGTVIFGSDLLADLGIPLPPPLDRVKLKAPVQVGAFTVDCEFSKVAEECNDALCEDMRISAKGPVWYVPKAAVSGLPTLELESSPCSVLINQLTGANNTRGGESDWAATRDAMMQALGLLIPANREDRQTPASLQGSADKSKAATASSSYSPGQYYEGSVVVAYGHAEVKGKHTNKKYDEGFLEATLLYFVPDDPKTNEPKPIVPDSTTFVTEPYKYQFTLKNREPYGSY